MNVFEKDVKKIQKTLNDHEGHDLGLTEDALSSISGFMKAVAKNKKKKFKTFNGIMFGFGLFISKAIISKHGGVLIKDIINGDIDVLVPHGELGSYRIFYPHRFMIELFNGRGEDVNHYMEWIDCVMEISPSDIVSDVITKKK